MTSNTITPVSGCTSPRGPMGCRYHSRFVSVNDIFNYPNKVDEKEKQKFFSEWFGVQKEITSPVFKMNKGEHSEALFSLRLLDGSFINELDGEELHDTKIVFGEKLVWHADDTLYIRNEGEVRAYPAPNLKELANQMEEEIRQGQGSFECEASRWYIEALSENGISIKAPSNSKSDIFIRYENANGEKRTAGISIKSMLGSSPSILNASGHATAVSYEVTGYDKFSDEELRSVSLADVIKNTEEGKSSVSYSSIDSPHFSGIIEEAELDKKALSDVVWKWKTGNGSTLSGLADDKDVPAFKQFFKIIMTSATPSKAERSKRPPKFMGHITKDGIASVAPFEKVWSGLWLDAPSRTRHDYGYLYRENGKVKMRVAIGVRYN